MSIVAQNRIPNKPIHIDSWNVSHYSMRGTFYPTDVEKISSLLADDTTPEPYRIYERGDIWQWQKIIKELCIKNILTHIFVLSKTSDIFAIQEPMLYAGTIQGDDWVTKECLQNEAGYIWNYKNPAIFENNLTFLENIEKTHTIVTSGKGKEGMMTLVRNTYTIMAKVCDTKNDSFFKGMMALSCIINATNEPLLVVNVHLKTYQNEEFSKNQLCQKLSNLLLPLSFSEKPEVIILGDLNWKYNPYFSSELQLQKTSHQSYNANWNIKLEINTPPPKTTNSKVSEKWLIIGTVDEYSDYIITSFPIQYEVPEFSILPKFPASDHRHISSRTVASRGQGSALDP
jgi:endonuclease/exonuclease/phosphatase family metal-dependent hydrolase